MSTTTLSTIPTSVAALTQTLVAVRSPPSSASTPPPLSELGDRAKLLAGAGPAASGAASVLAPLAGTLFATSGPPNTSAGVARKSASNTADLVSLRARAHAPAGGSGDVFERIVRVVPRYVWIALVGALLLAVIAGATAVWTGARAHRQAGRFAEVSAAALNDPLTGVRNRRGFIDAAERELERAQRYGRPLAVAFVDVRGLKRVNDSEGHRAGDALLSASAALLRDSARTTDVVGRLGGDEMGLLLIEQNEEGAAAVSKRIKAEVVRRRSDIGLRSNWDLTVGTAAFPQDGDTVEQLLRTADLRLYEQRGIELH